MHNAERLEIFRSARDTWSEIAQSMVLMEECGELITAVSQYYRGRDDADHVLEEIADVMVCCEQLILNMSDSHGETYEQMEESVRQIKLEKIARMKERLNK